MNTRLNRIFAIVMAFVFLFGTGFAGPAFSDITAAASSGAYVAKEKLPVSSGIEALRDEFELGKASEGNGYALDYAYYSPVGTNDNTKYPLVIFLHGIGHGSSEGSQLADSDMPYWASSELQSRFDDSQGAFILLPRAPEDEIVYWSNSLIEPLYNVIRDFIKEHGDNIDTTRIYISGSSQGGAMVWKMCKAYPGLFAAAFPLAATQFDLDADDVKQCSSTAFWIIASKKDLFVNYSLCTMRVWNNLCKYNDHPENCRLSSFGEVTNPDGEASSDNHHLAKVITYDLFTLQNESYPNMEVVDGLGNEIELQYPDGLISWMSAIHSDYDGSEFNGSGTYEGNFFSPVLDRGLYVLLKVVNIIQNILGL